MYLKRQYDKDADGNLVELGVIEMLKAPVNGRHNFSPKLVERGKSAGWLEMNDTHIIMHTTEGDVNFKITGFPGRVCLHDGVKLPDDPTGAAARQYIEENFPGVESPSPDWPAGYACFNYYATTMEA